MKNTIIEALKLLVANRYLLVLCSSLVVLSIGFAIYIGFSVHPSELQLVSHYSSFGITHLYRDQWYYLLTFGVFGIFVAIIHSILAIKLYMIKGHSLAILFTWLGIAIIILAWATAFAVLNVWTPVL